MTAEGEWAKPLPCPFCGEFAVMKRGGATVLPSCECFGDDPGFDTEVWNRRTPAPAREDLAKVVSPLIEWLTQAIHPRYERDDDGHLDTTKPERTHFIGNLLWIAEIQMLALVIDALRASPPSKSEDEVRAEQAVIEAAGAYVDSRNHYMTAEKVGFSDSVMLGKTEEAVVAAVEKLRAGKREEGA